MDFSWSAEARQRHRAARDLGRRISADIDARDRAAVFSIDAWDALGEAGLLGCVVPLELGGQGLSLLDTVYVHEGLARGCDDGGLLLGAHAHMFGCLPPLLAGCSDDQKARWLPRLASGDDICALAMSEAGAGSDAFSLSTAATQDGDHYVIQGEKVWTTNGPRADWILVFARTGDGSAMQALSAFMVPGDAQGLVRHPDVPRLGLRTCDVGPVSFDGVRVPVGDRVGAEGAGAQLFLTAMEWERIGIMTAALGSMDRLLTDSVRHVRKPRGDRAPLKSHQAVTHRLADLRRDLEASRLLLYQAAWKVTDGRRAAVDAALSKLTSSEAHFTAALTALRSFGAAGLVEGSGVERALRDATCGLIYSGTSDIQRSLVARMMGA